mgnify:CR=1 FL=1
MAIDTVAETARIDAAKRQLENSVLAREEARRDLLASDGKTPIHQPAEHARRSQAISDAFAARAAVAAGVAGDVLASVEAARLSEHADPLAALDLAQLNLAGAYRPFVAEDCANMPLPQLIGRLEWAAASKDKGLRYCYGRYGAQRFQALLNTQPQPAGLPELRAALEKLGAIGAARGLTPEMENLRFAADALRRQSAYVVSGNGRPTLAPVERL